MQDWCTAIEKSGEELGVVVCCTPYTVAGRFSGGLDGHWKRRRLDVTGRVASVGLNDGGIGLGGMEGCFGHAQGSPDIPRIVFL